MRAPFPPRRERWGFHGAIPVNYLELARRVAIRGGVAGAGAGKPATVVDEPSRRLALCIDFVAEAVRAIESEWTDWTFMRPDIDFMVEGETLNPADTHPDVARLNEESVFVRNSLDSMPCCHMDWPRYRAWFSTGYATTPGLPEYYAADPSGIIHFMPAPTTAFVLRAECTLKPAELKADEDVPNIPAEFHGVIVWSALNMLYRNDEAWNLAADAQATKDEWMSKLEASCLPHREYRRTGGPERPIVIRPV